jgi:hypothetical protein
MKLAKPVVNDNGVTLVREGTELTGSLIDRLTNLGIREIIVKGRPLKTEGQTDKPFHVLQNELKERFRPTQSNPLMRMLKDIFLEELRFCEEGEER